MKKSTMTWIMIGTAVVVLISILSRSDGAWTGTYQAMEALLWVVVLGVEALVYVNLKR